MVPCPSITASRLQQSFPWRSWSASQDAAAQASGGRNEHAPNPLDGGLDDVLVAGDAPFRRWPALKGRSLQARRRRGRSRPRAIPTPGLLPPIPVTPSSSGWGRSRKRVASPLASGSSVPARCCWIGARLRSRGDRDHGSQQRNVLGRRRRRRRHERDGHLPIEPGTDRQRGGGIAGDSGGPMTNGAMHTGTIDVGDLDVWTVAASTGEAISCARRRSAAAAR